MLTSDLFRTRFTWFVHSHLNKEWLCLRSTLEEKAWNKGAFHILTFSSHCALGVSFTSRSFPLCRRQAEKCCRSPYLSLHRRVTQGQESGPYISLALVKSQRLGSENPIPSGSRMSLGAVHCPSTN